jgi:hypothetical protein
MLARFIVQPTYSIVYYENITFDLRLFKRFRKIAKSGYYLLHVSVCLSIRPHGTTGLPLGLSWNFIFVYLWKSVHKIKFSLKSDKNIRYLTQWPIHIFVVFCSVLLRMRYVSDKTHILFSITFFFRKSYRQWDNVEKFLESDRPQMIWRMRIACYVPKTTNTDSEHVTLIPFPLQQWLHDRASMFFFFFFFFL